MSSPTMLDPICDMVVSLTEAREHGLVHSYGDREYAFCSAGCKARFAKDPAAYVAKVDAWIADQGKPVTASGPQEIPVIDAGIRAWYASCRCCLSEAHPTIAEALDAERAAAGHPISE